ncbi:MAG: TonB-dependent receptor [Gemmatimonadaceae bacterium]
MRPRHLAAAVVGVLLVAGAATAAPAQVRKPAPARPAPRAPAAGKPAPRDSSAPAPSAAAPTVTGVVYDSLAGAPLAGAAVQLVRDDSSRAGGYSAITDSAGHYAITGMRPGRYLAGFFHPVLDSLEIEAPLQRVEVGGEPVTTLDLAVPSPAQLHAAFCSELPRGDTSATLVGWVRDADRGDGVGESRIVLTWSELRVDEGGVRVLKRRVPARPRPSGFYIVCGLPSDIALDADADAPGGRRSGIVDLNLRAGEMRRLDFALADSTSAVAAPTDSAGERKLRGSARVAGTVRDAGGRPVVRANVGVRGAAVTTVTSETGTFALGGLPAGTRALEVRAIGYEPASVPVTLRSGASAAARVTLQRRADVLAPVTVLGKESRRTRDITGFLERSRTGMGKYLTAEDIEKRNPIQLTDALRMTSGIQVRPNGFGYSIQGRGGCSPSVFIDGLPVYDGARDIDELVRPSEVAGIEVYSGSGSVPGQFATQSNGCGTVLIWTKR